MARDPRRILYPMPGLPDWMGSVRFRLTVVYSSVLFGLAAAVVGGIYLGLSARLSDEQVTREIELQNPDGRTLARAEMVDLEELVNERTLEQLRAYSVGALGTLFVASLGVGWVVAGRALAPIHRITAVARDIQATDLTRRIELGGPPDELSELADTFDEMLARIDDAFATQRRFIQDASHELRNPLAVIRTNLDVVLSDPKASADELRETGTIVLATTDRMGRLVDDLLLYARQEAPSFHLVPIDVGAIVAAVGTEFRAPADARDLELDVAGDRDLWVMGDEDALRRSLANFLANAVRLAPERSRIRVAAGRHEGWIWMAVEDQGPGISPEEQDAVWQRFWRGDDRRGRKEGRSGLGLSIVRQIAEAHRGEVRLASELGRGSTFSIWIPEAPSPPGGVGAPAVDRAAT